MHRIPTLLASTCLATWLVASHLAAQVIVVTPAGQEDAPAATPVPAGAPPLGTPRVAPPKTEGPAGDAEKKGDDTKEGEKKNGEKKDSEKKEGEKPDDSIKRPHTPPQPADPRELLVRPENGLVRFNFNGQPWLAVLQWLADCNNYSLDWQELPKDYVNITTTRQYTLAETRDLFNRLLMDRGYTMVQQGRVLSVFRISKIDPSLLLRVDDESQLMDLPAHDFVKITFPLPDQLKADEAAKDVQLLLSPHGKVHPLLATNRLLVIDAVINLREVSRLINSEHAAAVGHSVPREFPIRFARAERVADQVMILLGLDPTSRRTPQELQVEQQRLQLFQQMQQRGTDISKYLRAESAPKVFLAVNARNNSVLANAPPTEMGIIERAVQQFDVPSLSSAAALAGELTMRKYQLITISPQSVVTALEDIGDLDPRTRLRTDSEAKILFAHATARDHEKISAVIDSLDGTGRQLKVIWLRRLPADAVAATIFNLMVGKEEEKRDDDSRRSYLFFDYGGRRSQQPPKSGFRVDADIERNRLLLWATESEVEEVQKFLEQLGEVPGRSGNPHTVRFLDPRGDEATQRVIEQLERLWSGPNELRIEAPPPPQPPPADDDDPPDERPDDTSDTRAAQQAGRGDLAARRPLGPAHEPRPDELPTNFWLARQTKLGAAKVAVAAAAVPPIARRPQAAEPPAGDVARPPRHAAAAPPPITIAVTPDGRIVLSSPDTAALDQLEDLLNSLTPPTPAFKVFYLKYALASLVSLNLEEYFEEDSTFDTESNWWRAWYGMPFEEGREQGSGGLGARRKIRFIYDYDTNSILVTNASPGQMRVVEQLIEIYDKPPSEDSISARSFQIFKLQYSRADAVAKTIKEVFRDLLSSKDKDFQQQQAAGEKPQSGQNDGFYRIAGAGAEDQSKPTKVKASFEGALSVGVDEISNTVIISAQEEWMPSIAKMIEYLDENAKPQTAVLVQKVHGSMNARLLQAALADALGEAWLGSRPPKSRQQPQQPPQPQPPAQPQPPPQQPAPVQGVAPAAAPAAY